MLGPVGCDRRFEPAQFQIHLDHDRIVGADRHMGFDVRYHTSLIQFNHFFVPRLFPEGAKEKAVFGIIDQGGDFVDVSRQAQ